jgi:hypothetical protein
MNKKTLITVAVTAVVVLALRDKISTLPVLKSIPTL